MVIWSLDSVNMTVLSCLLGVKSYVSKTVADVGIGEGADEFSEGVASAKDGDSRTGVGWTCENTGRRWWGC